MRYIWQHIGAILDEYKGEAPLHHFLKNYYRQQPKLGSRDRRLISQAIYSWYRVGKAISANEFDQHQLVQRALFLCGGVPKQLLGEGPALLETYPGTAAEAANALINAGWQISMNEVLPKGILWSGGMTEVEYLAGILQQPRLFLRIRKNAEKIGRVLDKASLAYNWLTPTCLALPNGTDIAPLLLPEAYVVQDASSQATGIFFAPEADEYWWDCCSGAGGKSLLLKDMKPSVRLLSSDVRESILRNLRERFALYDYPVPKTAVLDAADKDAVGRRMGERRFDGIICDVPCTGSGTWGRTPESLYFFDPETIGNYAERGARILRNVADYLKPGGKIIYITCSVFREENEDVVLRVAGEANLELASMQLINGMAQQADSLFVAVLSKPI